MTLYTLVCAKTAESMTIVLCDSHAKRMPSVDNDKVFADPCDADLHCESCAYERHTRNRLESDYLGFLG